MIIALFTLSNSTDAFLLLRAEQSGIPTDILPLLWVFLHISKVVFSLIGGDLSDRIGRKKMIFAGWILYALVYAGFAFVDAAWQAWVLFFIYGAYFGLTEGVEKALVADLVEPEKRGTAYGFYNLAFRHHGFSGFNHFRRVMEKIRCDNGIFGERVNFDLRGSFAFNN